MRMICLSIAAPTGIFMLLAGCEAKLETGYVPRPLNSSQDDRRAFYAPEFTPESHPPKEKNSGGFNGFQP